MAVYLFQVGGQNGGEGEKKFSSMNELSCANLLLCYREKSVPAVERQLSKM